MRDFDAKRNAFGGGGLVRRSGRAGVRYGGCHGVVFACASNSTRAHKDLALHASGGGGTARATSDVTPGRNGEAKRFFLEKIFVSERTRTSPQSYDSLFAWTTHSWRAARDD